MYSCYMQVQKSVGATFNAPSCHPSPYPIKVNYIVQLCSNALLLETQSRLTSTMSKSDGLSAPLALFGGLLELVKETSSPESLST